jgi:hypothetical protein
LELADLVLEIVDAQLVKHDHVVVAVLAQQALEADAAQVILAEGFDVLCVVDLALGLVDLANLSLMVGLHFAFGLSVLNL